MIIDIKKFKYLVKKYYADALSKEELLALLKETPTELLIAIARGAHAKFYQVVAIELLLTRAGTEVDQILMTAVKDQDNQSRLQIIAALGTRPGSLIDLALIQLVIDSDNRLGHYVTEAIFQALALRPSQMVTGFLIDCVWSDEIDIFMSAIEALADRSGVQIDETLIECAKDVHWNRHQGAFAVMQTRPGALIDEALISASKNEGLFGQYRGYKPHKADEYRTSIRWAAAKAMNGRMCPNIDQALISLSQDVDHHVCLEAVKAMANRPNPAIKKALQKVAKMKYSYYHEAAETAQDILKL